MNIIVCAGLEVTPGDAGDRVPLVLVGVEHKKSSPNQIESFLTVTFKIPNENILNLRMRNAS